MQLNMRHATAKVMPAVARMEKMTVRERCTDTTCSKGTPSYGITPPGNGERESECYQLPTHMANNVVKVFFPALITYLAMSSPPLQVGR